MNDNKLIAEFMEWKLSTDNNTYMNPEDEQDCWTLEDMMFDIKWDWLMPVVEKCLRTGDNTDKWDDIYNAVCTIDIKEVYIAVVKFIEEGKDVKSVSL